MFLNTPGTSSSHCSELHPPREHPPAYVGVLRGGFDRPERHDATLGAYRAELHDVVVARASARMAVLSACFPANSQAVRSRAGERRSGVLAGYRAAGQSVTRAARPPAAPGGKRHSPPGRGHLVAHAVLGEDAASSPSFRRSFFTWARTAIALPKSRRRQAWRSSAS